MRNFFALVMSMAMLFAPGASGAEAYLGEGADGDSTRSAYVIDSAADLTLLRNRVNAGREPDGKHYRLGADVDIRSEKEWAPIGTETHPFKGHFDGGGRAVRVDIDRGGEDAGLFGAVDSAGGNAVSNLNVTGTVRGGRAGGIVVSIKGGVIQNCGFSGTLEGRSRAGGIVAVAGLSSVVNECSFSGTARASGASSAVGGIAGQIDREVRRCTVSAGSMVSASGRGSAAGGIVGFARHGASVLYCASHASIEGAAHQGGIAGIAVLTTNGIKGNRFTGADREVGWVDDLKMDDAPSTAEEIHDALCGPEGEGGLCDAGAGSLCLLAVGGLAALRFFRRK